MPDSSDSQLIAAAQNGSSESFGQLVRRYEDRLVHSLEHALGSREEALDVAQQAFVSAWSSLPAFRQDSSFYSWLYRIAMNAAISNRRRRKLTTQSLEEHLEKTGRVPADLRRDARPEYQAESDELVSTVRRELMQLPEEFRQPLVLREMDGMSYDEIASVTGVPIGTVRSRIFRARQELTKRLQRVLRPDD